MSEFRKDPLTGRGVIISPERAERPKQLGPLTQTVSIQNCPFCPGNENATPPESWADRPSNSRPNQPGWSIRVVPNKYPAVTSTLATTGDQSKDRSTETGVHEVIIENPAHVANLALLDDRQVTRILYAYRARLRNWRGEPRWRFRLLFKNQGERAGATFEHTHAQLVALPFVPADVAMELVNAGEYYRRTANCYYCALIECELQARERIVANNAEIIALCPAAPRFAFETWLLPRLHAAAFEDSDDVCIAALAMILRRVVIALDRLQANPPFNYYIQSLSLDESEQAHFHWQLRLLPQFSRAAGFEWGSGMHINPVAPEDAARILRDAAI